MPVYPSGGTIAQSVGSPGFGPAPAPSYNASASVRFNPADTAYFSYVPTLQGSRTTWTWSGWVKRSVLGNTYQELFGTPNGASDSTFFAITFGSNGIADTLGVQLWFTVYRVTTQVFRDTAQWYHILCAVDTTQSTAADRVKLYVNGTQVTAFSTTNNPAQFAQLSVNAAGSVHAIGRDLQQSINFGGYLADINFVDGLALTPSSFTATDSNTGQLVPAQYTGNRGTNGFYLPFSGAALAVDLGQNPKTTAQDFPYWPYSTLLVNTTSTNGAQNNTFLDSSTNNFTITRNGNTTQGNFTPFNYGGGTAQTNGYYSGYFDSTGDYLSLPASGNASYINGTGNFTIDFWVYYNALPTGSIGANTGCSWYAQDSGLAIVSPFNLIQAGNTWYLYADTGAGTWNIFSQVTIATTTLSAGQWYHVACVRDSTNIRLYINGVQVGTASIGAASIWQNTVRNLYLFGAWQNTAGSTGLNGYVSNYRLVKGTCLYPNGTTFTVPTTPLTAIANTSLLTCQSSQFIDNSTNAFAITTNGNSQPLPTNPFGMTAWSGYFDGAGDYLTVPSATATTLDADFTIEYFMYRPAAGNNWILTLGDAFLSSGIETYIGTSGTAFNLYSNNAVRITSATLPAVGAWSHVAMVRSGSTVTLYLNGVSLGTWTSSATFSGITYIGAERYNGSITGVFTGHLSNVRIVKGTALYTANFTPPTAPLTAISGTSLLTCQSSTFVDNSPNAFAVTVNGNPYTLTLNNPFGNPINYTTPPVQAWSTYFDGSGDYISTTPTALTYGIGTNLFTWESWIYTTNSSATAQGIWHYYTTVVDIIYPYIVSSTGTFNCQLRATNQAITTVSSPAGVIRLNQWHHVVVTRDSATNISLYVDGKKVANGTIAATTSFADTVMNTSNGNNPIIGAQTNPLREYFYGYISNVRFVKGAVVYTGNFTPPTAPLTAIPGTMTLACQSNRVQDNSIVNAAQVGNADTSISSNSPFFPTQAWSAASYGGTMYFDGTGDYLTVPSNAAFDLGSGNATIETWIYPTTSGQTCGIFDKRSVGANYSQFPQVALVSGAFVAYVSYSGSSWAGTINGATPAVNTWTHVAFVRNGNTWTLYVNGVISGTPFTAAGSVYASTDSLVIGASTTGGLNPFRGYISNARILKGTALYTTPFVPPVLPPTAIANTSLLLNATNAGITDATGQNVIETVGNAQVSTAVKKWGTSSMYFDKVAARLIFPASQNYNFSTNDFTIEFWMYSNDVSGTTTRGILQTSDTAGGLKTTYTSGLCIFQGATATGSAQTGALCANIIGGAVGTNAGGVITTNAWYHVAIVRLSGVCKMYVNGAVQPVTATISGAISGQNLVVGGYYNTSYLYDGYLQDVRVTRGVGRYSGNFTPPAAAFAYNQYDICNQQWLPNNISVTAGVGQDNLVDSPSDYGTDTGLGAQVRGNYATMNPLRPASYGAAILTNGSLNAAQNTTVYVASTSTVGVRSGKWYWEVTCGVAGFVTSIGITSNLEANGFTTGMATYHYDGTKYIGATNSAYGAAYTNNDVIGFALDLDAGTLVCYKNGASQGTLISGLSGTYYAYTTLYGSNNVNFNFGQRAFAYAAPSGFKCLVSTNLPTTNNIGATSSTRADDYFNPVLYTGTGASLGVTGVGFQPDLVWVKGRSGATNHGWYDAVRGVQKQLESNTTTAETTQTTGLTAFGSDGFTVGSLAQLNTSAATYVAWNWKANGAGVANTAGTIPSTVSANTTSGCSIVTYTGNGTTGATVGHGLGAIPGFIITKKRGATTGNWQCWHNTFSGTQYITLNATNPITTLSSVYNATPTSTVIQYGNDSDVNTNGSTYVAYCFAPISGFSAMGSYTGNGSADGPMIYMNFRPAYVLIKRTNSTSFWQEFDADRSTYNPTYNMLLANVSDSEYNQPPYIDFLSNGIKMRGTGAGQTAADYNLSGGTYIYIAFAEFPFKYSRAR